MEWAASIIDKHGVIRMGHGAIESEMPKWAYIPHCIHYGNDQNRSFSEKFLIVTS